VIDNEWMGGIILLLKQQNNKVLCILLFQLIHRMAFFSETIIYRSSFSTGEALERLANAIETKGITHIEYWTEPAKFFRGKVTHNGFSLTYAGNSRSVNPDIEGTIQQANEGSLINVKISFPGSIYSFVIFFAIALLLTLYAGIISGLLLLVAAIPIFLFSIISYKWKCSSAEVLLEEIFQVKGEEQASLRQC
jgi:hypothetical protein